MNAELLPLVRLCEVCGYKAVVGNARSGQPWFCSNMCETRNRVARFRDRLVNALEMIDEAPADADPDKLLDEVRRALEETT